MKRAPVDYSILDEHRDQYTGNRLGFARYLNSIDPSRTIKGWEMAILRWEGMRATEPSSSYSPETDTYSILIGGNMIQQSGDKHRAMLRDYSNYGGGLNVRELAFKYALSEEHVKEYLRIHGWTHFTVPITEEESQDMSDDEIIEELAQQRLKRISHLESKRHFKEMEKNSLKYQNFEQAVSDLIEQIQIDPAPPVQEMRMADGNPYALVVCPTDFHWGKHGWVDEVGETYDFEEARARLFEKTQTLISRLATRPDIIYVGVGSDWFHVDNDLGKTTAGTPQDMTASPAEILTTGCKLAREHIDLLRQVAPVKLVIMPGNHDRWSSWALMMYLSAAYETVPDCDVEITHKMRTYIEYGNSLLGFTHGDGFKRGINLSTIMAVEAREQWGATKGHYWFHGHLHHQRMTEKDGTLIFQMPSLAGHDRYHYRRGYVESQAGLGAYMIDYEEGYIGQLFAPVVH